MITNWHVWLYIAAVLIPLGAFAIELIFGRLLKEWNAYLATAAIATSCVLSLIGFVDYFGFRANLSARHHARAAEAKGERATGPAETSPGHAEAGPVVWAAHFRWIDLSEGLSGSAAATPAQPGPTRAGVVIPLDVYIDSLAVIMFAMVTFVATLIHLYSIGYMHGDVRYPRFFTYLSLFCFSMLALVASGNLFMVFMSWELVGVCSYLLIGHWYEETKNALAANKAFIVNRVGDVGMLIGLGLLLTYFGTFNIAEINRTIRGPEGLLHIDRTTDVDLVQLKDPGTGAVVVDAGTSQPRQMPYGLLVLAGLGVFAGCVGKSAQFPLHVWLPDAMAGPTPVSALIHAATMVAAGVYLVGRFFPLFTNEVLLVIAYAGGITLFIAASIAMVQTDYKKVLAYSTVSQLGFMMLALGVGGWAAGLFHLLTHAFFKALLFLGAGSVYHSVHTYEMPVLGGLYSRMKTTAVTMLIGTLAISGVPFFSGFYSKDAILASAIYFSLQHPAHVLLFILPAVGATMTAFYMFRMWFLTFGGEPRGFHGAHRVSLAYEPPPEEPLGADHPSPAATGHEHTDHHDPNPVLHAHESPAIMTVPLMILAFFSIFAGWTWWFGLPISTPVLEQLLEYGEPLRAHDLGAAHLYAMMASVLIATAGIGLAFAFYFPAWGVLDPRRAARRFPRLYRFLAHKWYFDELYRFLFLRGTLNAAGAARAVDTHAIDGIVNGSAWLTRSLSRLEGAFDANAVDGLVNGLGKGLYALGDWGRGLQTGRLRSYLAVLAIAVVGLSAGVFFWIRGG